MKKYLITGASGAISQIIRGILKNERVVLWSRKKCDVSSNEIWVKSESLENLEWWNAAPINEHFDAIFHMAEPINQPIKINDFNKIIDSHTSFLSKASLFSGKIFYPQTAYKYDEVLSKKNSTYLKIKEQTISRTSTIQNLQTPVIHPLIDYGNGLAKIKYLVDLIPFFNTFCTFDSSIAVLDHASLKRNIEYFIHHSQTNDDWFSKKIKIHELFHNEYRVNNEFISRCIKALLTPFTGFQNINLLIKGRKF